VPENPIRDVDFGTALNISLDNYYDLLKAQMGGLKTDEFLQLKLVADSIDISPNKKASEGGYMWRSINSLLQRADRAINPTPVDGEIQTSLESLHAAYGRFLNKLRTYVTQGVLTPEDQARVADLDLQIRALKKEAEQLERDDRRRWFEYADDMGYDRADDIAYLQWTARYGNMREVEQKHGAVIDKTFVRKGILNKQYPDPSDKEVVEVEARFDDPSMRMRYPVFEDNQYDGGDRFSVEYLSRLPAVATGTFDDWRVITWDKSLETLKAGGGGSFTATFDRTTQKSTSITTDWKVSGGGGWKFIKVKASASEHTSIQEDFKKALSIELSAKSTYRVNLLFPAWFQPALFSHRHVKQNPFAFTEFFGPMGSLLYYPSALIVVRGFGVTFNSQQNWTYDFKRKFSASGGGGFKAFGVNFGSKGSYSKNETEHQVAQSTTKLTISDDANTIRFVGYAVTKNHVFDEGLLITSESVTKVLGEAGKLQKAQEDSERASGGR
jgi:hypothetical protein